MNEYTMSDELLNVKTEFKEEYLHFRNKVKMFILPLLDIRDNDAIKQGYIDRDNDLVYLEVDTSLSEFDKKLFRNITGLNRLRNHNSLLTLSLPNVTITLDCIRKAKYSHISNDTKKLIIERTDEKNKDMIDAYLYPFTRMLDFMTLFVTEKDNDEEMLKILLEIGETLSVPREEEITTLEEILSREDSHGRI